MTTHTTPTQVPTQRTPAAEPATPDRLLIATNPCDGWQVLVTLHSDGTGEVATRPDSRATWGIPVALEVAP